MVYKKAPLSATLIDTRATSPASVKLCAVGLPCAEKAYITKLRAKKMIAMCVVASDKRAQLNQVCFLASRSDRIPTSFGKHSRRQLGLDESLAYRHRAGE